MNSPNRMTIGEHLFEYELNIIGKTKIDVIDDDRFFFNNTLTREQYGKFKEYAIPLLQKIFKCRKSKAEGIFQWFYTTFGLRIKG